MGLRGIPPTPTRILELRGSRKAEGRTGEPQAEQGAPPEPELTPAQLAIWRRLCDEIDSLGVLTVVDGWQLERYARFIDRWRNVEKALDRLGTDLLAVVVGEATNTAFKRLSVESRKLDGVLKQIEQQFGLTPSARVRLVAEPKNKPQGIPSRKRA